MKCDNCGMILEEKQDNCANCGSVMTYYQISIDYNTLPELYTMCEIENNIKRRIFNSAHYICIYGKSEWLSTEKYENLSLLLKNLGLYCRECGATLDENNDYCIKCGKYSGYNTTKKITTVEKLLFPLGIIIFIVSLTVFISFMTNGGGENLSFSLIALLALLMMGAPILLPVLIINIIKIVINR